MEKKRADSISAVRSPRLNKLLRFYFLRFFRRTKLHGWEYDEITAVLGGARRKTRGKKRRGSFAPAVRGFHQDAKGMGLYMSDTAKPLRFFLGANTPQGFVSRFDQLADPTDGWREFVIKGGPGAGKSTLMKRVADFAAGRCGQVELIHCSSDADSLDGVILPDIKTSIADGTPPHDGALQYKKLYRLETLMPHCSRRSLHKCRNLSRCSRRSRLKFFAEAFFQKSRKVFCKLFSKKRENLRVVGAG